MRGLVLCCLALPALAQDGFEFARAERVARINFEIRQVAAEEARLKDERAALLREKACVRQAGDLRAMKSCSR